MKEIIEKVNPLSYFQRSFTFELLCYEQESIRMYD